MMNDQTLPSAEAYENEAARQRMRAVLFPFQGWGHSKSGGKSHKGVGQ